MIGQLRAEVCKQRSTQTTLVLFAAMAGLVALAIALHVLTLDASSLASRADQLVAFEAGTRIGMMFAAIAGALVITAEFRYGTIRPTFLVTPQRSPVFASKVVVSAAAGLVFGLVAEALMAAATTLALNGRNIDVHLVSGDYTRLLVGGTIAAGFWALIGLGVGAIVREQVPAIIGLCTWVLLIEHLLPDGAARFTPGNAGLGLAINAAVTPLHDAVPGNALAIAVLVVCSGAAVALGWRVTLRRDAT